MAQGSELQLNHTPCKKIKAWAMNGHLRIFTATFMELQTSLSQQFSTLLK
jgi:hypothetical protein